MVEKVHECNELVILHRLLWMRSCELDMLQESYIVKNITYIYETTMKVPWAMALDPKQFMCSNDKLGTNKHILQRIGAWASYPGTWCRVYSERHVQQSDNLGDDYYFFSEAEPRWYVRGWEDLWCYSPIFFLLRASHDHVFGSYMHYSVNSKVGKNYYTRSEIKYVAEGN
jgi:hypothetical protein